MKAEAKRNVRAKLAAMQKELRFKLGVNRYEMKKLVNLQTTMKRELAEMAALVRSLDN